MLTTERAHELLDYDSMEGVLRRKFGTFSMVVARSMWIENKHYVVANVIWLMYYGTWPTKIIDHKDRNEYNIKIENLREATTQQNSYNTSRYNPLGIKGVYDCGRAYKRWQAQIRINGKKVNLGRYYTVEEAHEAYLLAALEHHGDFVCLE